MQMGMRKVAAGTRRQACFPTKGVSNRYSSQFAEPISMSILNASD